MSARCPFPNIRSLFPYIVAHPDLIYLDTAVTAHKPRSVIEAMDHFYRYDYATVHRAAYQSALKATELFHEARKKVAHFLKAKSEEEIIFTKGTTESLNLIAHSLARVKLAFSDEILILETEHHANIVPWQQVAEEKGAKIVPIPVNDQGEILLDAFQALLSKKTRFVCIAHVSNVTGIIHPIAKIAQCLQGFDAVLVVDGAQSASHMPIDVEILGCDFFAFSSHKAYGPTGIGALYGKKKWLDLMLPYQTGGEMIEEVTFKKTTFRSAPYRFEAGTPMIAEAIGFAAAIDFLLDLGMEAVYAWEKELTDYTRKKLKEISEVQLLGDVANKGPIFSFNVKGIHHLDLAMLLDAKNIAVRSGHLCSQPSMERFHIPGVVRVSLGIYNTKEEIDRFIKALKECIQTLK